MQEFIIEIEKEIKTKTYIQYFYYISNLFLTLGIAACGFLTAAASHKTNQSIWIAEPNALLMFGLISACFAGVNHALKPLEKHNHHKNVKLALQAVRGAVKFQGLRIQIAEKIKMQALIEPLLVLERFRFNRLKK